MANILVVDDAPETLAIMKKALGMISHQVTTCANPLQALERLGSEKFDLVFLDIMMPGMDGLELCQKIRAGELNRDVKIVIFSAKSDTELVRLAKTFGADFYLSKPAQVAKIHEITRRMVGG
ncbi:MAG: response regulator [Deltaproteobacteria bacterium]|nr:response regulator [Deltaproteobacteria bacterium]